MPRNVAQKLIEAHLVEGKMEPGAEIAIHIDQTLTQDATGTLVMLELEAMGLDRARTEVSAQYVDHNLLQEDNKNAEDHIFLQSACRRFGIWFSRPGGGVSHPVHMQRLGKPGKTLLGSDSHTCAAGSLGMLAIGAGGLEVAMAIAGEPFRLRMPKVMGVHLKGALPDWVGAKDVILEMLRRHGVRGGIGIIVEYYGEGLGGLSAMDRHTIANMGAELGATTSVFPSDEIARRWLRSQRREEDWVELVADEGAAYDLHDEIDLSRLEPLVARPSSPGNVVPVREVAGTEIYQSYVGSSANPGYKDTALVAEVVRGKTVHPRVSLDINPASRQLLELMIRDKRLGALIQAGARLHQAGCNGCIGMGQAPAIGRNSLRTVPRNFPGRSGTAEDCVWLCGPEVAAASALTGVITDPRTLEMPYPRIEEPDDPPVDENILMPPLPPDEARQVELVKGANIESLPELDPLPDDLTLTVLLKVGDDVSTDEIMPAGSRVLPFRSNIRKISEFVYERVDETYHARARELADRGGAHAIVGGSNYGQGSSREHAALAPRYLGLRVVIAKSFARIHHQNLANFGILPLVFVDEADYGKLEPGDAIALRSIRGRLQKEKELAAEIAGKAAIRLRHNLSPRQIEMILQGSLINIAKQKNNRK
ncbi:MAG: aconitate hydratase [Candidatus Sumerlaeia bacterium]